MLDVRRLRLLRELAHRGTIAAVADALSFSPSAVSQQLTILEREAGVALLERSGRRVVLTQSGRDLVVHTEAVLEVLERAAADLAGARDGLAGPLRIGTFPSAARTLAAGLAVLARDHPRLEPMVDQIDPAEVAGALRGSELDVALVHDYDFVPPEPAPGLDGEPLLEECLHLAAPSGWRGVDGDDPIARWRDAPWITAPPGMLCHRMAVRACQSAGFAPRIRHHIDDFAAVLGFVAMEQGVAIVPQLAVVDPPPGVALTELPMHRRTRISYRRGADRHPAVSAFVRAMRSVVR
ncbi:DNA-binding transcriptional LysR family regulator [Saccharopolyspora erythraea NRRL 2338]|uniref:Transcriptional regulator n=2 Tax=Saccharopolyspora erythraea TaxID=1836 RepID=A4FA74_SACEN|nr:LysR family transcriptional regulator [Saccharopolyspora erythraea]EQD83408.1 LysR family transcriptional regulator [Saccharopolyspora erythraea D]PFG94735.1 DNA-binding transcriptional LysR family regulator [Saccharopolyspora erythraea NRRL 2338]QRK91457.1 LysR family transcriptional regulator [Saccharopolyspora erythraea]CAM00949.1 putative transcriptional regulator [Saccharopolyspora erythraea NRRL 2338]